MGDDRRDGLELIDCRITNSVKCVPPENKPTPIERDTCRRWLDEEIALVQPRALVALGATAARSLLGRAVPVTAHRGQWKPREDGLQVLVTLHPSALLRVDAEDREAAFEAFVADLRQAQRLFRR